MIGHQIIIEHNWQFISLVMKHNFSNNYSLSFYPNMYLKWHPRQSSNSLFYTISKIVPFVKLKICVQLSLCTIVSKIKAFKDIILNKLTYNLLVNEFQLFTLFSCVAQNKAHFPLTNEWWLNIFESLLKFQNVLQKLNKFKLSDMQFIIQFLFLNQILKYCTIIFRLQFFSFIHL